MKKTYFTPEIKVVQIKMQPILDNSMAINYEATAGEDGYGDPQ